MRKTKVITLCTAIGVAASTITAVYATVKACRIVRVREEEQGFELSKKEVIKETWKCYIPPTIIATTTIIGIFGNDKINTKTQASLVGAYALLDQAYKQYRTNANEVFENADEQIWRNIVKKDIVENEDGSRSINCERSKTLKKDADPTLYYDFWSRRYFTTTTEDVDTAINECITTLYKKGKLTLNTYYRKLGLSPVEGGDIKGWTDPKEFEMNWEISDVDDGPGREGILCVIMDFKYPPHILLDLS